MSQRAKSANENLHDWFVSLINYFRSEYETLSEEEKKFVQPNENYRPPCQIEVFWLKEPSLQLVVKTNFPDRPDMEIVVNGPYDSHEFIDKVDSAINSGQWSRVVEGEGVRGILFEETSYAETLASFLSRLIDMAKGYLFFPDPFKGYSIGQLISLHAWAQIFVGNMSELDYVAVTNSTIRGVKTQLENSRKSLQTPAEPIRPRANAPQGYGVFFFPPIVVGKIPKLTPSDILRGRTAQFTAFEKSFDASFNGYDVIVTKDGFIFIAIPHKDLALKALNTIMAVGTLRNPSMFAVREHELAAAGYDKGRMQIGGYSWNEISMRSLLFQERFGQQIHMAYTRREVNEGLLRGIIKDAAEIFQRGKFVEELRLMVEAFTHLNDAEYAQSFVMSWSIIERHVSEMWKRKLDGKNLDGERIGKLLNPSQWSIDYLLEVLHLDGEITDTDYDVFMEMKGKRNKFIRQGRQIAKEDAERCLDIAKDILTKKLNL